MTDRYSPLHQIHLDAGASFTDFAGWQMPVRYTSDLAEHHAVRTTAGIFDISHMAEISVLGADAPAFLDYALAGRLSSIHLMQAKYSLLLNEQGGIIDDLIVYHDAPGEYLVVANAGNRAQVVAALRERSANFADVRIRDRSDDTVLIAVQGPHALAILEQTESLTVLDGQQNFADLKYYWSTSARFKGGAVFVGRTGYTGEDGFELYIAVPDAVDLWRALAAAGEPHGLVPAGLASRDTLRLEAGMPLYGHELGPDTFPVQAGLGRVVNLAKEGDFVGRRAIEAGPSSSARILVGLRAEGKRAGRAGYLVYTSPHFESPSRRSLRDLLRPSLNEREPFPEETARGRLEGNSPLSESSVGLITSGALSPTLGHPIAMAYVEPEIATPGTELFIDVRGTRIPASVVELPFYKRQAPSNERHGNG